MACFRSAEHVGADLTCHSGVDPERYVFLNVLEKEMPECSRRENASRLEDLDGASPAPVCYVYCAQRSCGAAREFMAANEAELSKKCASVAYLPGGALEMKQESLVDGPGCHSKIVEHNMQAGIQPGCLTCQSDDVKTIPVTVDGQPVEAKYIPTSGEVPDWYRRSGIVGSLPTQFSCDERYKGERPQPHQNLGTSEVRLDISDTGLPENALLAYWAAKSSDTVTSAETAYGDFQNSGIVECEKSVCKFTINPPSRYTAEGKVFKKHIHITEWLGDQWNLDAKTIDLE